MSEWEISRDQSGMRSYHFPVNLDADGTPMIAGERMIQVEPGIWQHPEGAAIEAFLKGRLESLPDGTLNERGMMHRIEDVNPGVGSKELHPMTALIKKAIEAHSPLDGWEQWYVDYATVDVSAQELWDVVDKTVREGFATLAAYARQVSQEALQGHAATPAAEEDPVPAVGQPADRPDGDLPVQSGAESQ